jgi:hypothetical protein
MILLAAVLQICRAYGAARAVVGHKLEAAAQRRRRGISVEPGGEEIKSPIEAAYSEQPCKKSKGSTDVCACFCVCLRDFFAAGLECEERKGAKARFDGRHTPVVAEIYPFNG